MFGEKVIKLVNKGKTLLLFNNKTTLGFLLSILIAIAAGIETEGSFADPFGCEILFCPGHRLVDPFRRENIYATPPPGDK